MFRTREIWKKCAYKIKVKIDELNSAAAAVLQAVFAKVSQMTGY